ncbi:class I SAM-dependent methyltransferase [Pseudomonas sp. GM80]|uniref:class I SAM-dependent methyltransferase n=1 Tax=Pseudomonas sp. GM80 TaxID=1144339 RepID=UPI00026FC831|nr:class I SAM-dependent methyltransferase [Pseudomonas sp. GM80]EJN34331.1 methylase involved in ubiquinone/menaquinone biosynthesis [Pseudomonas sp. GM80]
MSDKSEVIRKHYEGGSEDVDLVTRVKRLLEDIGEGQITSEQLAGLDQFHSGGLKTTADFIELLEIQPESKVLDAGSGLGGPSRYTAEGFGCHVTGVDLTESFVDVAKLLADRTGLNGAVQYQVGNLLDLDFADEHFDVVYTQHVVMNIRDRAQVYKEIHRVLKPGGVFGSFDVLAVDGQQDVLYPVPWAESSENSVLLTEAETRSVMENAGLQINLWEDVTQDIIEWFDRFQLAAVQSGAQGPTLKLVMGDRFGKMAENFARNLRENKVRLVMARSVRR